MQAMEFQIMSLPIYTKKEVDLPGARRQEWYPAVHGHQPTWQNGSTTAPTPQKVADKKRRMKIPIKR